MTIRVPDCEDMPTKYLDLGEYSSSRPLTTAGVRSVAFFGTRMDICSRLVECSSNSLCVHVAIRSENFREAAAGFVIEDACVVAGKGYMVPLYIVFEQEEGGSSIDDEHR